MRHLPPPPHGNSLCSTRPVRALMLAWALLLGAAAAQPSSAAAPPAATPRQRHTAECTAALQVQAEALAARIQAGQDDQRPPMRLLVRAGAAFLGKAFLAGDRDEDRAHDLLDLALDAQKALPPAELAARQAACLDEGRQLLDRANVVERALITKLADRRMKRLLELAAAAAR